MTKDGGSGRDDVPSTDHVHSIPPSEVDRYTPRRDPYSESDIINYVEGQAPDESVRLVERVKREVVLGDSYEIWDVTSDKNRWWVITNLTNLYSHEHFPSLDYTLSFHIGLMMRLRSRPKGPDAADPTPFDDVLRRLDQAERRHDLATEVEDFQAVGMQLRECLISLVAVLRQRVEINSNDQRPKQSDVVNWLILLFDALCPGRSQKELRGHVKATTKSTWQLVNWLTHHRSATASASTIALDACRTLVGHSIVLLTANRTDATNECPRCSSRQVRTHFAVSIGPNGDYFVSCASCGWTTYPVEGDA